MSATMVAQGSTGYLKATQEMPIRKTVTVNLVHKPRPGVFTTYPNVCNGETKTFRFNPAGNGGSNASYSSIEWQGLNGASIVSVTDSDRNAEVSLSGQRGIVRARVIDVCQVASDWTEFEIGTAAILQAYVNGNPSGGFHTISNPALLNMDTKRATNFSWVIEIGNGSLIPSGSWCTAFANNFIRVIAHANNSCGTGDDRTFYLTNGDSYMVYPNPVNEELNIDFVDKIIAEKFLNEISLKNEKGEVVRNFKEVDEKRKKTFENKKSVSMDVRNLPKGTYYLNVIVDGKETNQRVFIGNN